MAPSKYVIYSHLSHVCWKWPSGFRRWLRAKPLAFLKRLKMTMSVYQFGSDWNTAACLPQKEFQKDFQPFIYFEKGGTGVHLYVTYIFRFTWEEKTSVFLPWYQLHLHIWCWTTNSCFQYWSQSDERLSEPCPQSPLWFGPTPPHSALTWRLPGKHGSGWGQDRPSPWFSPLRLLLLGVCHILGRR